MYTIMNCTFFVASIPQQTDCEEKQNAKLESLRVSLVG